MSRGGTGRIAATPRVLDPNVLAGEPLARPTVARVLSTSTGTAARATKPTVWTTALRIPGFPYTVLPSFRPQSRRIFPRTT